MPQYDCRHCGKKYVIYRPDYLDDAKRNNHDPFYDEDIEKEEGKAEAKKEADYQRKRYQDNLVTYSVGFCSPKCQGDSVRQNGKGSRAS